MYWPQQTIGVVPAGAPVVSYDTYGQPFFHGWYQQPMQVVGIGVMPTVAAGMSGFVQGIAGLAMAGRAAFNGGNRPARAKRQPRRRSQAAGSEEFQDCLEEETAKAQQDLPSEPRSPMAEPSQDAETMNQLIAQLEHGGAARSDAIDDIRGSVLELAVDPLGCRAVQLALEVASQKDSTDMALELQGHVYTTLESKHGNYVVQKIIEVLPISAVSFMIKELEDRAAQVARHPYGCRILCRLFEHAATESGTTRLVDQILSDATELSRHAYGYHVIKCILEHGKPQHRERIAYALLGGAQRHAKHRTASFVMEKALAHCDASSEAHKALASELLARPENTVELARHQFGRHVVTQLVRLPGDCSTKAIDNLRRGLPQVQSSKHGRRLVEELRSQLECSTAATHGMGGEFTGSF